MNILKPPSGNCMLAAHTYMSLNNAINISIPFRTKHIGKSKYKLHSKMYIWKIF